MKAYVVNVITDYARPLAITANKKEAEKYMKECKKEDTIYHKYYITTIDISDTITEI